MVIENKFLLLYQKIIAELIDKILFHYLLAKIDLVQIFVAPTHERNPHS